MGVSGPKTQGFWAPKPRFSEIFSQDRLGWAPRPGPVKYGLIGVSSKNYGLEGFPIHSGKSSFLFKPFFFV